jgi:hypothetical protein
LEIKKGLQMGLCGAENGENETIGSMVERGEVGESPSGKEGG